MNWIGWILGLRRDTRRIEPSRPTIEVTTAPMYEGTFTSPNPYLEASLSNVDVGRVGRATYTVSPLFDRVYVFSIEIESELRGRGYGLAFLQYLSDKYKLPITAIKELHSASNFWNSARGLASSGLIVTQPISWSDTIQEETRWAHLRPDRERLEKQIAQRKGSGEKYRVAVGRGLDAPPANAGHVNGGAP